MTRFRYSSRMVHGTLHLQLFGVFDGSSAWELRHALEEADAGQLVIDFSGVDEAYEFGATVLGAGLNALRCTSVSLIHVPEELHLAFERFGLTVEDGAGSPAFPRFGVRPGVFRL